MKKYVYPVVAIVLAAGWFACKGKTQKKKEVVRDTTINKTTSFNNLFLDSNAIQQFLDKDTLYKPYAVQFQDFYKHRNFEYAWFDSNGLGEQAGNFLNLLSSTVEELKDSSLYSKKLEKLYADFTIDSSRMQNKAEILQAELYFTGQFFKYASRVYEGADMDVTQLGWFIPRKKIDLTAVLDSVIRNKAKKGEFSPLNPQYGQLQSFLPKYYDAQKDVKWDSIPVTKKTYKAGDSDSIIGLVKQRLVITEDLPRQDSVSNLFDSALTAAVRSFQQRTGLTVDGKISPTVVKELNVPLQQRIQQIMINMERMRWLPSGKDSDYIIVNIPEYKLHVFEKGKQAFDMNVIVGTEGNSTVIFNGKLKYVVFAPYWNVPSSIVRKEIVPGMNRNSNYLDRQNMEITGHEGGLPVVRQKPGPKNSLGLVKFLFPNNYNIYLHDTPNRELFSRTNRSFSHGCIRIQEPAKMAQYLLADQPEWTTEKIDSAMNGSKEKWVTVANPVSVFICYLTAWVDDNGKLNFRKDIYGHDAKMAEKLFVKK
ncbi:murein L,D-transpeptidase YcbB/YkuD [Filimonas zeae]|uniref:Peptidoglycan-binding protein n=1 Tax=Filimonas zeae TaxID=1737353 RepID=A0A917J5U5_9BACT|nr:L,D-transpeptidase family protein [Filimonas zeae]MDR6341765.1 murein L,D-transpeptidase YcbB/YkuD [Filimonas zeae]GGH80419.1 peptidoglycan-binding protein [Filimonas zeae]